MSQGPETFVDRQIAEILEKTKIGDDVKTAPTLLKPQSYTDRLEYEIRNWRARLIIPSGGLTAASTAVIATRLTSSPALIGLATFGGFLVGLGIGEGVAIGISHLQSRRSS